MSAYNIFSHFYDVLTYDVNYKARAKHLINIFKEKDKIPSLLLDFACGTGSFSTEFAKMGIDVIGVDMSENMLAEAQQKNADLTNPVLYLCQKGSDLDLYGTVDGAVSCLDSLNHITDYQEFCNTLNKISLFLEKDRLFIFDLNTPYKHREVLAGKSFHIKRKGVDCVWRNRTIDNFTVEINLNFSYKTGLFKRETISENFLERAYTEQEIENALTGAGLQLEAVYGENTNLPPKDNSQRNIYVARKVN